MEVVSVEERRASSEEMTGGKRKGEDRMMKISRGTHLSYLAQTRSTAAGG